MGRILIVSNRLPLSVSVSKRTGRLEFQRSAGGLATGLGSVYRSQDALWVGWPGMPRERLGDHLEEVVERLRAESCHPVFLTQAEVESYYFGFSNRTIWPLFHYFSLYAVYSQTLWEGYRRVNEIFCEVLSDLVREGDTVWIHDYHLMLLPSLVRRRFPEAKVGFFLHIPFPSFEVFRLLPWRRELLEGMLGADLIGFHTYDYVRHFIESVRHVLGYEHSLGQVNLGDRVVQVDAFPMGIDYERYARAAEDPAVQQEIARIRRKVGDRKVILSVDRLDYTKGIPQRLEAFDRFLEQHPQWREKVVLILVAVPSRMGVEHYMMLKRQVDELIGRINGKYGSLGWVPIWYLYRSLPFVNLAALYHVTDVALVTPLRDGMNLIAKEFVASKVDGKGVLILSEMAGAAKELGEAIIVNPNSEQDVVNALSEALSMSEEQVERNRKMQRRLQRYHICRWVSDFLDRLEYIKGVQRDMAARRLTPEVRREMMERYRRSRARLLLLDYDGTLVPFSERPERAGPDPELREVLKLLAQHPNNEVMVISGRDKAILDQWLGDLGLALVAEHGVWIRERGGAWEMIEPLRNDWKEQVRPILEIYVDRTPGSFLEEKEFSLVWHYRKADPELASVRARELKEALLYLTANLKLGVMEGSGVIEIKDAGINKGRAAMRWLGKRRWGFILAAGDDWTDEDLFAALPPGAYSIKVGLSPSRARFNVATHREVRGLLRELTLR